MIGVMKMYSKEFLGGLAEFFKIFGDETRLRILDLLVSGEKSVNEIARKLDVSQSAVSHLFHGGKKRISQLDSILKAQVEPKP